MQKFPHLTVDYLIILGALKAIQLDLQKQYDHLYFKSQGSFNIKTLLLRGRKLKLLLTCTLVFLKSGKSCHLIFSKEFHKAQKYT